MVLPNHNSDHSVADKAERGKADAVILSVRLQSGAFEASLSVPIRDGSSIDDFKFAVERWLALTFQALQHGVSEMRATLEGSAST